MLIPVILSGGTGTRLWPVSREAHPKPFMKLPDGQSLLEKAFLRAAALGDVGEVLTVTNRDYYFLTRDEYTGINQSGLSDINAAFLLEPQGRNTAPAIAMAALKILAEHGPDAVLLVTAADHLIERQDLFANAVKQAHALAQQDYLVTFGIIPDAPETGFGYIECGAACDDSGSCQVSCFVEKPSREAALDYVASGRYLWNSGMFCFKTSVMLEELRMQAPAIYQGALACWEKTRHKGTAAMLEIDAESFACLPNISIDYAVMEKARKVAVVPGDFGWSDIGSWSAISALQVADDGGNSVVGEAILVNVDNSYFQSDKRMIAAVGVQDLIVVDTPDALLIVHRDHTQDVKLVAQQLKQMEHESYKLHRTVARPWGTYTVLEEGAGFKLKRIVVKPGAALSLQMHHHRSEHWIVVSGIAQVVNGEHGDDSFVVNTNESTYIPAGNKHRLVNPGQIDLVMIEVQTGNYLGEDDIVRFDDIYGRVPAAC